MTDHLYARIAELEELLEQAEEAITLLWVANMEMAQAKAELIGEPPTQAIN